LTSNNGLRESEVGGESFLLGRGERGREGGGAQKKPYLYREVSWPGRGSGVVWGGGSNGSLFQGREAKVGLIFVKGKDHTGDRLMRFGGSARASVGEKALVLSMQRREKGVSKFGGEKGAQRLTFGGEENVSLGSKATARRCGKKGPNGSRGGQKRGDEEFSGEEAGSNH